MNLAQGRLTVLDSKTEAGREREIDLWPELREALAAYKAQTSHAQPERLRVRHSDRQGRHPLEHRQAPQTRRGARQRGPRRPSDTPPIPPALSPHSLRRTFASLLYLRGENPVYVMHQMGHTDPKLALRIYTKVMGEQRRRGPGARLVGVLDGARWTEVEAARLAGAPLVGETSVRPL